MSLLTKRVSLEDVLVLVVAVSTALVIGGVMILAMGVDPLAAYQSMFWGAFGSVQNISETMLKATPLMLAGVGLAIAYRGKVWNLGAEGQIYMGAWVATWAGIVITGVPQALHLLLLIVVSFAAGALWGLIPGFLRTKFGLNEILTTLMMNYVATFWVSYLVRVPMRDPGSHGYPESEMLAASAWLPRILPGTRLNAGFLIALASAVFVYIFLFKTIFGYKIRAVGASQEAARYAGIGVAKYLLIALALSGGLAGIAGMVEISGIHYRLRAGFSPGYGFTAVVVSLLGKNSPLGVVLTSILFAALIVGSDSMQHTVGVPFFLVYIIQGLVVLFVLGRELYVRRWKRHGRTG